MFLSSRKALLWFELICKNKELVAALGRHCAVVTAVYCGGSVRRHTHVLPAHLKWHAASTQHLLWAAATGTPPVNRYAKEMTSAVEASLSVPVPQLINITHLLQACKPVHMR